MVLAADGGRAGFGSLTAVVRTAHPAVIGTLDVPVIAVLDTVPARPGGLEQAGARRTAKVLNPLAPWMAERPAAAIAEALAEQTVVVPGTRAVADVQITCGAWLSEIGTFVPVRPGDEERCWWR